MGSTSFLFSLFVTIAVAIKAADLEECPHATPDWVSPTTSTENANLKIINAASLSIYAAWVDRNGNESPTHWHFIEGKKTSRIGTYVGHRFRFYVEGSDRLSEDGEPLLLLEHEVQSSKDSVTVVPCAGITVVIQKMSDRFVSPYAQEMEALVHDQNAACEPADDSTQWSCINYLDKDQYQRRLALDNNRDGTVRYGFGSKDEAGSRKVGATVDHGYTAHIPRVPRLTKGKGYLKMSFTEKLRDILLPWYERVRKGGVEDAVTDHGTIPGGYTNSHLVKMSKISLDDFRHVQTAVYQEMRRVLEWWTAKRLVHSSTFGVRIYHRGSMLVNHVDRANTHLASAVIQVAQHDLDEGWPLEVLDADGNCAEVYLQPGEMVLYEGARFRHGRPMRFNGSDFANIFNHFRPMDWHGPGQSPNYDGRLDKDGYLIGDQHETKQEL